MIIKAQDYNVEIGPISESNLQLFLNENSKYTSVFILVDENTHEHCLSYVMYQISGLESAQIIEIPSGEENKVLEICAHVWLTLTENESDRNTLLINLGGGVIGDMGGFIASTYKRGIDFIQIPTTLLAQVDASVGGKVGIDLSGYKNQIGLFSNPQAVFIDSSFLETLDERQLKSGFSEMLKHGLIADESYWERLNQIKIKEFNSDELSVLIEYSVAIKNKIVLEDPKESGLRKILNFGHTIGHALESLFLESDTSFLHGESIAVGMIVESILSKEIGLKDQEFDSIFSCFKERYTLPILTKKDVESIMVLIKNDKKNNEGKLNFTLLESVGKASFDNFISEKNVIEALSVYNTLLD